MSIIFTQLLGEVNMYIRKYSRILDYFFITTGIIILSFCWIRFYTHNSTLSIILAIMLGLSIGCLCFIFNSHRLHRQHLTTTTLKRIQTLDFQLSFANSNTLLDYFSNILKFNSITTTPKDNYLILPDSSIIYPYYLNAIDELTIKKILSTIPNNSNITIISSNFTKNVHSFCKNINNYHIQLLTTKDFLDKFHKNQEFTIPSIIDVSKPKITINQILKGILDRKKSKTYLILGALLLLYTFLIPFKIYYLVFGSILLLLSILSRFSTN